MAGQRIDQAHRRVGDDGLALLHMMPGATVYIYDLAFAMLTWSVAQGPIRSDMSNFHKLRYQGDPRIIRRLNNDEEESRTWTFGRSFRRTCNLCKLNLHYYISS
ncbi:hypothetical protein KCU91_g111, partial [Aureobasidium melanogenum]